MPGSCYRHSLFDGDSCDECDAEDVEREKRIAEGRCIICGEPSPEGSWRHACDQASHVTPPTPRRS